MIKTGNELGITVIKSEYKETTDKMKDLHHRANAVVFQIENIPVWPKLAEDKFNELATIGKELSECQTYNERQGQRKEDLLRQMRDICRKLKAASEYTLTEDDTPTVQKIVNYRTSVWIRMKDDHTPFQLVDTLSFNKYIYDTLLKHFPNVRTDTFVKSQKEMMSELINGFTFENEQLIL